MKLYTALTAALILPFAAIAAEPQVGTGETDGYHLVWQDLFDADELNPLRWNIEENGSGGGNSELQYYTARPENVRLGDDGCGNHCLILTARRENYKNRSFTSGRINSKNLIAFTHGKIEAAIKLPSTADGLWPAFWMMGNDYDAVGWPRCGEIDIMEFGHQDGIRNGTQDRYFNGACHWGPQWPQASYANSTTKSYSLQDGQFHIYTMIWDDDQIAMYIDLDKYPVQTPYYRMTIPREDNEWSPGYYFHKLNFILFNLAIGGNFPGIWEADKITALNPENGQEASMYVNYVRVYQKGLPTDDQYFVDPGDKSDTSVAQAIDAPAKVRIAGDTLSVDPTGGSTPEISIYDGAGRLVSAVSNHNADLRALTPGIYLARITADGRQTATLKFRR